MLRPHPERVWSVGQALAAAPSLAGQTPAPPIVGLGGEAVDLAAPVLRPTPVFLYRDLPVEPVVPFGLDVLYRDENIVVVDKPHFLATMPRGRHVTETALVRLRRLLGSDDVAPAHRLDRLTAGVLLLTLRPEVRSAYQDLFAQRRASKVYRALAPAADWAGPVVVRNRILKTAGDLRAREVDGEVNAVSVITRESVRGDGTACYRLMPETGRTHQLRLHMAGLGVPILGDPLYPRVDPDLAAAPDRGDFTRPLRLLAAELSFDDPLTGEPRRFVSRRDL